MQTDKKQSPNQLAMSRALGAAFLSHQVEQLEKSVGRESRSATSNNWRERNGQIARGRGGKRGGVPHTHPHQGGRKRERKDGERGEGKEVREQEEMNDDKEPEKDADTVVVDASVLVYALGQVKKWCKDGRQEEIVIPLEALNTLDLLKKGSTPLAQRARAASRILEAQVGTNPRIRVQRDDAFVLWDEVPFSASSPSSTEFPSLPDAKSGTGSSSHNSGNIPAGLVPPPEWLRRTICCGTWEVVHAMSGSNPNDPPVASSIFPGPPIPSLARSSTPTSSIVPPSHSSARPKTHATSKHAVDDPKYKKKVVLAVMANSPSASSGTAPSSLDASTSHPGRHERADGSLVRIWAQRAGIEVMDINPSITPSTLPLPVHNQGRSSPEKRRTHAHGGPERRDHREKDGPLERERKPPLVEKPIAMTIVNEQPVKVLRVLARGEKLDP